MKDLQILGKRFITQGLHVHIGINDCEKAIQINNALRIYLPLLLALSTSSPFFEGEDTAVLEALKAGAAGGVGATYNMMPDRFVKLYREFKDGHLDAAQDTQAKITECLVAALPNVDTIAATKQVVNWLGLECGYGRTPNRILTEDEQTRMRTGLERVGFFD